MSFICKKSDDFRGRMKCSPGTESCGDPEDQGVSTREEGN
jgi:hypothetical protein